MKGKVFLNNDVNTQARARINELFDTLDSVYVAFSGGKDSGVLLHLVIEEARKRQCLPIHVLYVDMEAQYQHTHDFIKTFAESRDVVMHWVCLPLSLRNASSQYQPKWVCWDPEREDVWVRALPVIDNPQCHIVTALDFFPFYYYAMEFEEFVKEYGLWLAEQTQQTMAALVGIRSDESLNRYRTIKNRNKGKLAHFQWTTKVTQSLYLAYPIYDWKVEDVWAAYGKFGWSYNHVYDLMHKAGVSLHQQRLCQPYGDDQKKGLWLYHILEPQTWERLVVRVEGCNFGARYSKKQGHILGYYNFKLPAGYSYKAYSKFLLDSMPPHLSAHYRSRIFQFLIWWKNNGKRFGVSMIPDSADRKLESKKKVPSWRRICKTLIKNDYWCRGLSFSQTKKLTNHYIAVYQEYLKGR
ncbi:DUF3440 domain-containing protein [Shewanella maritima]|uniref:DUF3440 domain-containing protein n=1 Tax=Shewanella maritima TaxID=2520507 RepID=A0A411PGB2_9GAMM|nr:DUF3440 domain-containing protein [Shewanella maritima]QBF82639.1 DUF3440 domain-containing protein [Shewanella maritima]